MNARENFTENECLPNQNLNPSAIGLPISHPQPSQASGKLGVTAEGLFSYMPKRFTETTKWDDPWFRRLSPTAKCFWEFICCACDNAGVWKIDYDMASFRIGASIDSEIISQINKGKERIKIYPEKELAVILDFVPFQIGNLSGENKTNLQKNALKLINDYVENKGFVFEDFNIVTSTLPVPIGYRYKGKGISKGKDNKYEAHFEEVWSLYPNKDGKAKALKSFLVTVKSEIDLLDIKKAIQNYLAGDKVKEGFIKNGSTFFNQWRDYVNFRDIKPETTEQRDKRLLAEIRSK